MVLPVPLATCTGRYLGAFTAPQGQRGCDAVHEAVKAMVNQGNHRLDDRPYAWVKVFSNGVAVKLLGTQETYASFYKIYETHIAKAWKYRNQLSMFVLAVPLKLQRVLCLIIECRNTEVAHAMEKACYHAYRHRQGWQHEIPSKEQLAREADITFAKFKADRPPRPHVTYEARPSVDVKLTTPAANGGPPPLIRPNAEVIGHRVRAYNVHNATASPQLALPESGTSEMSVQRVVETVPPRPANSHYIQGVYQPVEGESTTVLPRPGMAVPRILETVPAHPPNSAYSPTAYYKYDESSYPYVYTLPLNYYTGSDGAAYYVTEPSPYVAAVSPVGQEYQLVSNATLQNAYYYNYTSPDASFENVTAYTAHTNGETGEEGKMADDNNRNVEWCETGEASQGVTAYDVFSAPTEVTSTRQAEVRLDRAGRVHTRRNTHGDILKLANTSPTKEGVFVASSRTEVVTEPAFQDFKVQRSSASQRETIEKSMYIDDASVAGTLRQKLSESFS